MAPAELRKVRLSERTADSGRRRERSRGTSRGAALLIAAILGLSVDQPVAAQDVEEIRAATRLVWRWRGVMNQALEDYRAYAEEAVIDRMEEFVSPGALRATRDKATEEQLKRADGVLLRFVDAIVKGSDRRPDGSVIVAAEALEPAEKSICPIYPFCD